MNDDSRLIALMKAGDRESFDELAIRNRFEVCNYITSLVRNRQEVEEVWQQTLITVWTKKEAYNFGPEGFKFWLFAIAKNVARKSNSRKRKKDAKEITGDDLFANQSSDGGEHESQRSFFEATSFAGEKATNQMAQLELALESLPVTHRQAFLLGTALRVSSKRIATLQNVPLGTVLSRQSNAKAKIRRSYSVTETSQPVLRLEEEVARLSAITLLSPIHQQVLLLSEQGLSYKQMAERLGCSVSVAGVRLSKARQKLLEQMKKPVSCSPDLKHERACLEVVNHLPEEHRSVLALVRELSYKQIAARLGIKVGTVSSRLANAYRKLARRLDVPIDEVKKVFQSWWRLAPRT